MHPAQSGGPVVSSGSRVPIQRPAALLLLLLLLLTVSIRCTRAAEAAQVPVRYPEGTLHGFLVLRSMSDSVLGYGDLLQTVSGSTVSIRMMFGFHDGSVYDESVTFTQNDVFMLRSYTLSMRGPVFETGQKVSLRRLAGDSSGLGRYRVETTERDDGEKQVYEGEIDLPPDTYNGMVVTIAKNLTKQPSTRVHLMAFTPKPRLVGLELIAARTEKFMIGSSSRNSIHFVIKPRLGSFTTFLAKLFGRMPGDNHMWIATDNVPAFVRSDGALFSLGPSWRIELASPRFPGR